MANDLLLSSPGKFGDLLWQMAVARAIAVANPGVAIDLLIPGKLASIAPLLQQQPYIRTVFQDADWIIQDTAPASPRIDPSSMGAWLYTPQQHGRHVALGYPGWPEAPLPQYVWQTVRREHPDLPIAALDLETPWITAPRHNYTPDSARLAGGFSDEHFELKFGIWLLVTSEIAQDTIRPSYRPIFPMGGRWDASRWWAGRSCGWEEAAGVLVASTAFLGCCSALHVLACALGKRCVIMEPAEARWNPIFWPYGTEGPRVTLVKGNDGKPTFDARHCVEEVRKALCASS